MDEMLKYDRVTEPQQDGSMYVVPTVKAVEIKAQNIICGSDVQGSQNEGYEEGSTEGWF